MCPILGSKCEKVLHDASVGPAGVCSVKPMTSAPVICCPIRLYADDYRLLRDVAELAFDGDFDLVPGNGAVPRAMESQKPVIAVFGKKWGGELRVPKKSGSGGYWVDWILALVNAEGDLVEFVAVEVQTIDTTGNYRNGRTALLAGDRRIEKTTVGLNWENVNKRILPQLIYKGQLLQREALCKRGLFFVCPSPVYREVIKRVGGRDQLPGYALQPASVTFMAYDYSDSEPIDGEIVPISLESRHSTTVYKMQEAFNNVTLTDENVYRDSILMGLGLR